MNDGLLRRLVRGVASATALACAAFLAAGCREGGESAAPTEAAGGGDWPGFRGPGGLGVSACASAPVSWNAETGEGVLWKAPIPRKGASSPVVAGGRVFLTGADEKVREVYCFSTETGGLLWRRAVKAVSAAAQAKPWDDKGYAASTAATDGERVCAVFASGDIACFDLDGKGLWKRSLAPLANGYGHASSPVICKGVVVVLLDQQNAADGSPRSKILGLDVKTGKTLWETPRPVRDSWSSPISIEVAGGAQLVTCSEPWVIAYDPATGGEIWRAKCLSGDIVPSPAFAGGLVFVAMETGNATAIRPEGRGDVTETHIAWKGEGDLPSVPSPVASGKLLFLVSSAGTISCRNAETGKELWSADLEISVLASPLVAGDRVYVIGDEGKGVVVAASPEHKELARNDLGECVQATPAFAGGRIYVRGEKHLFCIGAK
jgi:outer membrane protein assembly factor BamB